VTDGERQPHHRRRPLRTARRSSAGSVVLLTSKPFSPRRIGLEHLLGEIERCEDHHAHSVETASAAFSWSSVSPAASDVPGIRISMGSRRQAGFSNSMLTASSPLPFSHHLDVRPGHRGARGSRRSTNAWSSAIPPRIRANVPASASLTTPKPPPGAVRSRPCRHSCRPLVPASDHSFPGRPTPPGRRCGRGTSTRVVAVVRSRTVATLRAVGVHRSRFGEGRFRDSG